MTLIIADRVKETSTTTGTGAMTLGGALTGFKAFSAVCANADTFYYTIQAVDSSGNPAGDWEVGLGSWGTGGILTRTTVMASSNSNAAVSFGAGTKHIWIDAAANFIKGLIVNTSDVSASGYGETLTLPDATTLFIGADYSYRNNSPYDKRVKDNSGTVLGFIPAFATVQAVCQNISSAAGIWQITNLWNTGITQERVSQITIGSTGSFIVTDLDSDRQFLLFHGNSNSYGVIYNRTTNVWGSDTLIRSSPSGGFSRAIKSATDQILVISCNSTTGMEAVVLSISGTTITVNTAGTATLGGNYAAVGNLIQVGSSFVISYTRATTASGVRAISISGTSATIGAEVTNSASSGNPSNIYTNSSTVFTGISATSSNLYAKSYSVSGSTITAGTEVSTSAISANVRSMLLSSGRIAIAWSGSPTVGLVSVSGTTPSISSVNISAAVVAIGDWIEISSTKVCILSSSSTKVYANHLLDNGSGTASVGTSAEIASTGFTSNISILGKSGNTVTAAVESAPHLTITIDCSSTSPSSTYNIEAITGGLIAASSDSVLGLRNPKIVPSNGGYLMLATTDKTGAYFYKGGKAILLQNSPVPMLTTQARSLVSNEAWSCKVDTGYYSINTIEVAP